MQYFTIQARNHREAIENMKSQYGEYAKILTYRNVRVGGFLGFFGTKGVELTGYISREEKAKGELEDNKIKILEAAKKEQTLNYILKEIKDLKRGIPGPNGNGGGEHPSLEKLRTLLKQNDFPADFIDTMVSQARERFSLTELEDWDRLEPFFVDWIASRVPVLPPEGDQARPRVVIVVGPSGAHHHHRQLPYRGQAADRNLWRDHAYPRFLGGDQGGPQETPGPARRRRHRAH